MRWLNACLLIFIVSLLAAGLTGFVVTLGTYDNVVEYKAELSVVIKGGVIGFNVENDRLYFGQVPQGGQSTREVFVKNHLRKPTIMQLSATGDIAPFIFFIDNNYPLVPGAEQKFAIEARVPNDTPPGNYTGRVLMYFKKT